ncbi:phage tail sheath family protein [Burkholderia sp. SIMBA_062]|uniref:phage tail sheath family protein n=1 Tax=Burkholderia sp. SIMBA_062 TaxID=3085803 RepID=UPI003978E97C
MIYKVPGVYVEEPVGLSLSIQTGQTAVPVFAFDQATNWGGALDSTGNGIIDSNSWHEFMSWLDVVTVRQKLIVNKNNESVGQKFDEATQNDKLFQSLKLYFLNGGGRCYIAPVASLAKLVPQLDDVTLLVQSGSQFAAFDGQVKTLCLTEKTYFAIYDGPTTELRDTTTVQSEQSHYSPNKHAAVYYPWLTVPGVSAAMPPSGAVAGVYARVDRERGVWKAPANAEIIGGAPMFQVSDGVEAECNGPESGLSINVIRAFRGMGPLIWGARTLQSDHDEWRYVPVRRLFSAVEKDIKVAMRPAVFEPNSAPTWERVRGAIANYVHGLWQQGALQGDTPAQAYFVHIGPGITMTQDDVMHGRMIVKVGLAAVRPAEFIILQVTQHGTH